MRIYHLRYGKNAGDHYIYADNGEACRGLGKSLEKIEDVFPLWCDQSVKQWDWVRTDDGRVVQVLNKYTLPTGKAVTVMVKVVFGVYKYVINSTGKVHFPRRMDADPVSMGDVNFNKVNLSGQKTIAGRYLTTKKRLFAYYLVVTGNPVLAYAKAGIGKTVSYKSAFNLLRDKYVLQEVQTYMPLEDFKSRLKKAMNDYQLNEERFAEELNTGLLAARKGTLSHKQFIELLGKSISFINDVADITSETKVAVISPPTYASELPSPNPEILDKVDKEWSKLNETNNTRLSEPTER